MVRVIALGLTDHLHESIGQDTSQPRGEEPNHVEDGKSLLQIISSVPGRDEIEATRQETGLEYAEEESKCGQNLPFVRESETKLHKLSLLAHFKNAEG